MLAGFPFGYGSRCGAFAFEDDTGNPVSGFEMISSPINWTLLHIKIIICSVLTPISDIHIGLEVVMEQSHHLPGHPQVGRVVCF